MRSKLDTGLFLPSPFAIVTARIVTKVRCATSLVRLGIGRGKQRLRTSPASIVEASRGLRLALQCSLTNSKIERQEGTKPLCSAATKQPHSVIQSVTCYELS